MPIEYTFSFDTAVAMDDVAGTLALARLAAELLHGAERVDLGVMTSVSVAHGNVVLLATSDAGADVVALFLGYARREFGPDAVRVRRSLLSAGGNAEAA